MTKIKFDIFNNIYMLSCYLFLLNNMAQRKLLNAIKQNIDMSPSPIEAKKKK
jgi:hypothetical protein